MNACRTSILVCAAALLVLGPRPVSAQNAGVELRLSATTLEPGESVDAQLVCRNTGQPQAPQAKVPDGLRLEITNPTPAVMQSMSIVNGRQTSMVTYTFSMRLTALKEGMYDLGPVTVEAGGTTYQTALARVVVQATAASSRPRGDGYIFAEIAVSPDTVYISQTATAILTIGMRQVELGGRTYPVDLIRDVLSLRESQLSVFADGNYSKSQTRLRDSTGQLRIYEVFRITKEIRAEQVGKLLVGPVFLKANYPTRLSRDWFGRLEVAASQRETARADVVEVTVLAPPDEGRPPTFNGAIGTYTLAVEARPTQVELGQPITLALIIRGEPLENVAGPPLPLQPELSSRFDFTTDEIIGDVESGSKVFRRAIFPRQVGEQTVPSITWSYFDPATRGYVTLRSEPIAIQVNPSVPAADVASSANGSAPSREPAVTDLKPLTGGIAPNYVEPEQLLASDDFPWTPALAGTVALPPVVWLGTVAVLYRRRRLQGETGLLRRRRARRQARRRLAQAARLAEPGAALETLAGALRGYVADRFDLPPGEVTPEDVRAVLMERGFVNGLVGEIGEFLDACEAARYAPGTALTDPAQAGRNVNRWIESIEREFA